MSSYPIGQQIDISCTFELRDGTKVDPSEVHLQIRTPSGDLSAYKLSLFEITHVSLGVFSRPLLLNEGGDWWYRFTGVGIYRGTTGDVKIPVGPSEFPMV